MQNDESDERIVTRLPRPERRAQLIRAAAAAFLGAGYDGTSMEAVAERAGVTRLIVYRNFDGKEALYRAVLESVVDRLRDDFADADAPEPTDRPDIARRLLTIARQHPDAFRLLWRHARHEALFAAEAEAYRAISAEYASELIAPYIGDPVLRRWGAVALADHAYGGICTWLDDGDPDRDDEFVLGLQGGLRALVVAWSGDPDAAPPTPGS